jgi:hypothetical protein
MGEISSLNESLQSRRRVAIQAISGLSYIGEICQESTRSLTLPQTNQINWKNPVAAVDFLYTPYAPYG